MSPLWKRRLPWLALAASVALNIFLAAYVGGAMWHRPPDMTRELKLTDPQRAAYKRFRDTQREQGRRFREDIRPALQRSWQELAKPAPDEAAIMRVYDEALTRRRDMYLSTQKELRAFLATLEPPQRERFVAMEAERQLQRGPRGGRGPSP